MIELTRTHETHSEWKVKVLGVGGAGTHAVDRLSRDGLAGVEILAANTDARALASAVTTERIVLGHGLTRGLGAGGDPELGRAAAVESLNAVGERLAGASLVILMAGLGGGTGSGASPCIAQIAREQGAHVAVFATLPFSFEGRRRREQALEALDALREHADFVVCFENDRMPAVVDPASGIEDAFESVDSLLAQAVRAVTSMTRRRNVMHSGIDEIASTVAEPRSTALFGYGVADGEERARAAVSRAFGNPLLDANGVLSSVSRLWVYVAGGPDMRWSEVQTLMSEVSERVSPEVRLFFGAAVDPSMAGAISVTLLAGIPGIHSSEPPKPGGTLAPSKSAPVGQNFASVTPVVVSSAVPQVQHAEPASLETHREAEAAHLNTSPWAAPESSFADHQSSQPVRENLQASPQDAPEPNAMTSAFEAQNETPVLSLDEPSQAQHVPVRSTPVPPFERSKERRREEALAEAAIESQAYTEGVHAPSVQEIAKDATSGVTFHEAPSGSIPAAPLHSEDLPEASEEHRGTAYADDDPLLPLGIPRENGKRTKDGGQEQMRFEAPHRGGRFEKTDPTIVDGEDLDVPTFMRHRLPLE